MPFLMCALKCECKTICFILQMNKLGLREDLSHLLSQLVTAKQHPNQSHMLDDLTILMSHDTGFSFF